MARKTKAQLREQEDAKEQLREILSPGDTVYTVVKNVSSSGMSRSIDLYHFYGMTNAGRVGKHWLSYRVAQALGWRFDERRDAVRVDGAGMDMGFHLVYSLSSVLFPDGFDCIGPGCPASDHVNPGPDRNNYERGTHHRSGGYALNQEWL